MPKASLAIAIPTYGRAAALRANLSILLPEADRLGVAVHVSDDSPDDETELAVAPFVREYANFHYRRNTPSLRHDRNILETLYWPDSDYVWILGDALRPREGELAAMLAFLKDQDFVFINVNANESGTDRTEQGIAAQELLKAFLWHQTLTGATIYHRRVINWTRNSLVEPPRNFPQLGVILGFAGAHPTTIGWFDRKIVHVEPKGPSYWRQKALDVFVDDWVSAVKAHPQVVSPAELAAVLKSHSASTRLFNGRFLWELRQSGHFSTAAVRRPHFWDVMHLSPLKVLALMVLPIPGLKLMQRLLQSRHG